jgi:O-antigen ligase
MDRVQTSKDMAAPKAGPIRRPMAGALLIFAFLALAVYHLYRMTALEDAGVQHLTGNGNAFRQFSYLLLFALAVTRLRVFQDLRQILLLPFGMVLLLAWCWLSLCWAVEPGITLRRLALITIIIWTLFLCVEHAGYELTFRMIRIILAVTLVLNFLSIPLMRQAIHRVGDPANPDIVGSWRGILGQKNFTGAVCALTVLVYLFSGRNLPNWFRWSVIAGAAFFLWMSESKTSIGMLLVSLLIGWTYLTFGTRHRRLLIPIVAAVGIACAIIARDYLFPFNPASLSGRAQIWLVLTNYVSDHAWLGSGFGSFWDIGTDSPVFHYTKTWVARIASGHNGYLDLLAQLGVPGLLLTIYAMVVVPTWTLLANTNIPTRQGALLTSCLFFCVGHNFTESTILTTDFFVELFFLITIALTGQIVRPDARWVGYRGRPPLPLRLAPALFARHTVGRLEAR